MKMREEMTVNQSKYLDVEIKCVIGIGFKDTYYPLVSLLIDDGDGARRKRKILMGNDYE